MSTTKHAAIPVVDLRPAAQNKRFDDLEKRVAVLESHIEVPGPRGEQGVEGHEGKQGHEGQQGEPGADGQQGERGPKGSFF